MKEVQPTVSGGGKSPPPPKCRPVAFAEPPDPRRDEHVRSLIRAAQEKKRGNLK